MTRKMRRWRKRMGEQMYVERVEERKYENERMRMGKREKQERRRG